MSPAAPFAPRWMRPRESSPAPMPEPTLQKIRSSDSSWRRARSLKTSRFTSLSTQVGASNRCSKRRRTSKPFHPGMIGGATGRPLSKSTGPGMPTATPQTGYLGVVGQDVVEHLEGLLDRLGRSAGDVPFVMAVIDDVAVERRDARRGCGARPVRRR